MMSMFGLHMEMEVLGAVNILLAHPKASATEVARTGKLWEFSIPIHHNGAYSIEEFTEDVDDARKSM